jgi:hypothetical protein
MLNLRYLNVKASFWLVALFIAALLSACGDGGGGGGDVEGSVLNGATDPALTGLLAEVGAPQPTGLIPTDGFNWFNFRRQQIGLAPLTRNPLVERAAQAHSDYQAVNNQITHDEASNRPHFNGVTPFDRLQAAQYIFPKSNYAFGEVIRAGRDTSGVLHAEDLITAIYHRFVIFEPKFLEGGIGSTRGTRGSTYFTADFTNARLSEGGLGFGSLVTYPFPDQKNLPTVFFSDREEPDPVPDRNEVGYPVSVHVDITSTLQVSSFTINPRGGEPLLTKLLTAANDTNISYSSVVAIIPLDVLGPQTFYDVHFVGAVDGVPVDRFWSFKTR